MKNTLALLVLLAPPSAALLADLPPPPSGEVERVHNFAALSWTEASCLRGRRVTLRIKLNAEADSEAGRLLYDCIGNDSVGRSVRFSSGHEVENDQEEMIVEATLHIVLQGPWTTPDGLRCEGYSEYHLEDARRCR